MGDDERPTWERFPATRYQGSKLKLQGDLAAIFARLEFDTALDPMCGTGTVAYLLKTLGKGVVAGDGLAFNAAAAQALVANDRTTIGGRIEGLLEGLPDPIAPAGLVETVFDEIFFERDENRFVDQLLPRIHALDRPERELALWCLGQACLAKRPYNLFHRANLSLRRRDVPRTFGNKATWDKPFPAHIRRLAAGADHAVFQGARPCRAVRGDVLETDPGGFDLVYLDPPYVSGRGAGVDYLDFYHFLEGLTEPAGWEARILHRYRHKPLAGRGQSPWADPARIAGAFEAAIDRFSAALLVISYRSDGIPTVEDIARFLSRAGKRVEIVDVGRYTYALSTNRNSREVVLVGR
ncbi:MAG TPA: DNA adenine methylase [Polyangia bacterium]|nr:DNA adenine methylase [Polyangia bacterium]